MEFKLGARIRKLRIDMGVTQEELAEYVGVSFQAVSKWETDTTMPDISLLPKLAVFFSIKIDDLFSINNEDELERIDNMLTNERLTEEKFIYAKRTLDSMLRDNENDVPALKRYARLMILKANDDRRSASHILEKAMSLSPLDTEIYGMYRQSCGSSICVRHSDNDRYITQCEPYARNHPQVYLIFEHLIEALIENKYFDRAIQMIDLMNPTEKFYALMPEVFKGDVEFARGNTEIAVKIWNSIDKTDHKAQYEIGERFNRINDYSSAITAFENSFNAGTPPRDLSALYSLAFLYEKIKQYDNAIKAWEMIIKILISEWKITDGETIDWPKRELARVSSLNQ